MSIKVIHDVFDNSEMRGNDRLVMLSIAYNADNGTRLAWPSVANIAQRTRIPVRTVWRCIKRCVAAGELRVVRNGRGGRSNLYEVTVAKTTMPPNGIPTMPVHGIPIVPPSGTRIVIEPSVQPSVVKTSSSEVWRLKQALEAKQAMAEKLRNAQSYEVSTGRRWRSSEARTKYFTLVREINELNERISSNY